ncbi:hypothetical protein Tsubulata_010496 [Turnera subulata]|uniref:Pentacotripeptide-repeat region of PRORP domain-containing protein n=1 Tax=Turnera subulata TaxID=218843 RepID=A0A9Q0J593_9ROSI|nr:hypothetical protein Tsubulata_010496 [Turnera subulata]
MRLLPWPKRLRSFLLRSKHERNIAQVHAIITTAGLSTNQDSLAGLVASYARIGSHLYARYVFDKLPHRGAPLWTSMIVAYSRKNLPREVLSLYRRMVNEGVRPDSSTFTVAIKACSSLVDFEAGEEIWRRAAVLGYECDVFVCSSVLNLYAKCGKMEEAKVVFDRMSKRDVVCWTTMITGFVNAGKALEAVDMYGRMQMEGVKGDGVVFLGLVQACAMVGDLKFGGSVHGYMTRRGMAVDDVVLESSILDMYAKNGKLELASRVFKKMSIKNVVSWATLISGFAQNGFATQALEMLVEMQDFGFKPDSVCLLSAASACSQVGYLKMGKSIHGYIVRGLDYQLTSSSALIDMYAKCGALSCAHAIFDQMDSRDVIMWNTIISGYGIHGLGMEALSIFRRMTETNLKPNHATFSSLLSALSHSGLIEEGQYWFDVMVNQYKIQPSEKHYACMVDLFSRAGRVEEAFQLIESMNTTPGVAIWVPLLSGCHSYGKFSIGEVAAKKILESNPDDLGIYSLISNFFSSARKWNEVAILRKNMKKRGTKKVPGYSAVEVNGEHHAFLMEDKRHPQYEDISQALDSLDNEMRANVCSPDLETVAYDVEEEAEGI